ncbi:MAG: hypothetical protein ACT4OX_08420 [Actinomycetota bacterium]
MNPPYRTGGFVTIEWVAAIATLLLPVVLLVATLPSWAERRHAATIAAREAANVVVRDLRADGGEMLAVAQAVAHNYGVDPNDVDVVVRGRRDRRDYVTVSVTIRMPALAVPGLDAVTWSYTATQHRRIDDYRSVA